MYVVWVESFRIALREMHRHRTRSMLTVLGVIIGVAAIIAVISISQGAKLTIQDQIATLGTNMIYVVPGSSIERGVRVGAGSSLSLTMQDAEAIERECSAVAYASAITGVRCQATSELGNWSLQISGTTANYLDVRDWPLATGQRFEPRDVVTAAKVGLIGKTAAEQLFGQTDPVGQRVRVKGTPIEIVGLLAEKGQTPLGVDQDDTIIVPITVCFRYLDGGDRPNAFFVSATHETQIPLAIKQIEALLRQRHHIGPTELDDFSVRSIQEAAETAESTANVMAALLVSVAGISLLVGGIGIMNIMLVTVMERTREIGIRMAVGASRRMIMRQFMIEAGTLAGVGGLLGVALGLVGSALIAQLVGWPAIILPELLVAPLTFAVVIGIAFGLLPARRASRLSPVESLRHE